MAEAHPDLLVNGNSLWALEASGVRVESWDFLLTEAPYRGDPVLIPGMPGGIAAPRVLDVFTLVAPVVLMFDTKWEQVAALATIRGWCPDGTAELARVLPSDSSGGTDETYADALYDAGGALDTINYVTGRTGLQFTILSGDWQAVS